MRAGPVMAARTASRSGAMRGATSVRPPGAEHLQIDVVVAGIDRRHHGAAVVCRDDAAPRSRQSVESPIAGLPAASAKPRAAAMPTRNPVKLPGPVVTAMRSSSANSSRA